MHYYDYTFFQNWILKIHGYHRRGQQLLLAKVKNADRQDWYISVLLL